MTILLSKHTISNKGERDNENIIDSVLILNKSDNKSIMTEERITKEKLLQEDCCDNKNNIEEEDGNNDDILILLLLNMYIRDGISKNVTTRRV